MSTKNAWGNLNASNSNKTRKPKNSGKRPNPDEKFKEAHVKHVDAAKKLIQNYESSSDEEEINTGADILDSVFKSYKGESDDLIKTQQFLENIFQSGTAICLICIGTVKRIDEIWSCLKCYTFFHLQCIQRWSNDSISQKNIHQELDQGYYNNLGEYVPKKNKPITWDCPKCRTNYSPTEIPRHYDCFCGKEQNPTHHPWLIPHSCGETCDKLLQPECGHKCVLLCHPGPCPPCPQMILKSCKCEQSNPKMIRCSKKSWTCLKKCTLKLSCGIHDCGNICHWKKDCPPCKKRSKQSCLCGAKTEERNCSQSIWKCKKVCNKFYSCGIHKCEKVCHNDQCGNCPLGEPRSCPCGKQQTIAPCSEQVESCGDTCYKLLSCGIHRCAQRCHKGDCSQCIEIIEKKCRCGVHSKQLACSKMFTCDTKCKQMRECKKHACNRKCCDGQCPGCDKICGKLLSCTKHKCQSLCHNGPCYPCNLKSQVKCRCANTVISVPCGRERKTVTPKCALLCKIPSKCHHENPHRCHPGDCPSCSQICQLKNDTTNCDHPCVARCHDSVKILISDKNFKPALPWEVQPEVYEVKKLPHPKCDIKVPVICLGGHEEVLWPCWNSKPTSCQRMCGRRLICENHVCNMICHSVSDLKSKWEEDTCDPCQEGCQVSRSNGCNHPCIKPCHPPPCNPCNVNIVQQCHCGLTQVYYKCGEYYREMKDEQEKLEMAEKKEKTLSCGGRCIRNYPCGHRCISKCHSGQCPNPEQCKKKIKQTCSCKNLKMDISCEKIRKENFQVKCDETCQKRKLELKEATKKKELELKKAEDEKNRLELEEYEKKFGLKKKTRERKKVVVEEKDNKPFLIYGAIGSAIVLILSIILYFTFIN